MSRWQHQALAHTPGSGWLVHLAFCRLCIPFSSFLILTATPAVGQDWPVRAPVELVRSPRPAQPPVGLEAARINCVLALGPSARLCSWCLACALPQPPGQPRCLPALLTLLGARWQSALCRMGSFPMSLPSPSHGCGPDFCRWGPGWGHGVKALHCWCTGKALGPFRKRHDTVWQEPQKCHPSRTPKPTSGSRVCGNDLSQHKA